jgi:hypothetical protein
MNDSRTMIHGRRQGLNPSLPTGSRLRWNSPAFYGALYLYLSTYISDDGSSSGST